MGDFTKLDAYSQLSSIYGRTDEKLSWERNSVNGASHFTLWNCHHERGWYFYLIEKDLKKAKQEFYVCGRLDEELNKRIGTLKLNELGQDNWNSRSLGGLFHVSNALFCDKNDLMERRIKLTYPEHKVDIYQRGVISSVINMIIVKAYQMKFGEMQQLFPLIEKTTFGKRFKVDIQFFEALVKGDKDGMAKAINGIATQKVQKSRQKVEVEYGPWDNALLSCYGITYTKLAWIHGYELEIKSPLVSIANEFFPVKPLAHYDDVYDFANMG